MVARVMRRVAGALVAASAFALSAAPASAGVSLDEFSVTPAGAAAGGHPDVTILQRMSYSTRADDVRDSFVRLAPGLLGNPQNADFCGPDAFAADTCPARSQVGTVAAKVTVWSPDLPLDLAVGLPLAVPGSVYNLPPEGEEPARLGLVLRPATAPLLGEKVFLEAPVVLRDGVGGIGLESVFAEQPRTSGGLNTQITEVALRFSGQGSRGPFMRLPTSCAPAVSIGRASSYDSSAVSQRASSFTPTGCGALAFTPRAGGVVGAPRQTAKGDLPPVTTTLRFNPEEAALKRAEVTIPPFLQPNTAALARVCPRAQAAASACPASSRVGTATIDSPLQARLVRGPIYLAQNSADVLPGLIAILPPPVGLRLDAAVETGTFGTRNVFASNPDLPVRSFTFALDGGPGAVLTLTRDLCDPKLDPSFHVDLLAHSGKRRQFDARLATPGCDPRARVSIRRRGRRAKLVARLTAAREGPAIMAAAVRLPKTLRHAKRPPLVYVGRQRHRASSRRRSMTVRFPGGGVRGAVVVWRGLRASRKLRDVTRVGVSLTDARGRATVLRPEVVVRGKRARKRR
jgi:hypothetical protein